MARRIQTAIAWVSRRTLSRVATTLGREVWTDSPTKLMAPLLASLRGHNDPLNNYLWTGRLEEGERGRRARRWL